MLLIRQAFLSDLYRKIKINLKLRLEKYLFYYNFKIFLANLNLLNIFPNWKNVNNVILNKNLGISLTAISAIVKYYPPSSNP